MNTTGYYGKTPQRGDFVSGRLPPTFITVWDDWSQQLVGACKDSQTDSDSDQNTEQHWFRLPAYRFLVSADIAGDQGWIGLMIPSKDSVGRLFPLCLARNFTPQGSPATAMYNHQQFFLELEKLAENLYSEQLLVDDLTATLKSLDENHCATITQKNTDDCVMLRQSGTERLAIRLNAGLDPAAPQMWHLATESLLSIAFSGYSIWTTSPLSNSSAETILCDGLPTRSASMALFTGDFDASSWSSLTLADSGTEHREINFSDPPAVIEDADTTQPLPGSQPDSGIKKHPGKRETDLLELDQLCELNESNSEAAPWDD